LWDTWGARDKESRDKTTKRKKRDWDQIMGAQKLVPKFIQKSIRWAIDKECPGKRSEEAGRG